MKKTNTRRLVFTSMMAAIVYITSAFLQISIPTVIGSTRLHMGNVMCLLSGMLLGPLYGGIAAGVGSMLFDLTNPTYISSAPFTLVFKFGMAWLCGKIVFKHPDRIGFGAGAAAGAFIYVVLYIVKNFIEYRFVFAMPLEGVLLMTAQKGAVSCANAVLSIIVAAPLGLALKPLVQKELRTPNKTEMRSKRQQGIKKPNGYQLCVHIGRAGACIDGTRQRFAQQPSGAFQDERNCPPHVWQCGALYVSRCTPVCKTENRTLYQHEVSEDDKWVSRANFAGRADDPAYIPTFCNHSHWRQ